MIDTISGWFEKVERAAAALLLASIFVLLCVQVFWRYVLNSPLTWTDELARYSLVWLMFVASGFVMARGAHIAVHVITRVVSARMARWIGAFALLSIVAGSLWAVYITFEPLEGWSRRTSTALGLSMGLVMAAPIAGFGLMAFHAAVNAIRRRFDPGRDATLPEDVESQEWNQ